MHRFQCPSVISSSTQEIQSEALLSANPHTTMFSLLSFAVLCASCLAAPMMQYSFSPPVGGGSGTSFSTVGGNGRITAIRVWERSNAYISGLQVRFGSIWSARVGVKIGIAQELNLFDDETIVQVSGKYHSNYIYMVRFVTSRGRSLIAGQPITNSFNFYPTHPKAELKLLSGRFNSAGITSLGAHWGVVMGESNSNNTSSGSL